MEPNIAWLDLTASDRDKMQRVLDLFKEGGTVDEMGLGSLREALSTILFPGITSIQTRLRYVLFVPWIYRSMERRRIPANRVTEELRRLEVQLIAPLAETKQPGVIGVSARHKLQRLPSSVYWGCIRRWGIFQHGRSQSWYHSQFTRLRDAAQFDDGADDPGVRWHGQANWHPRLPEPPKGFLEEATFDITEPEAAFIQGRIEDRCAGSLLARLASRPTDGMAATFWEEPEARGADGSTAQAVEVARRFSLHVEGMPLVYNLMLAERRGNLFGDADDWVGGYSADCADWAVREASEEHAFDPQMLWALLDSRGMPANFRQRTFVQAWASRLAQIGPEKASTDDTVRALIADRERLLKGRHRARLVNDDLLVDWRGESGVGRMDFNWFRAREMLAELKRGLG